MDNQDSKLNNAIDAFREHKKKSDQPANPQSRKRRKARFCGVVVNKRDIQRGLNAMDTTQDTWAKQMCLEFYGYKARHMS